MTPIYCAAQARCGGCPWMALSPAAQRERKIQRIREALGGHGDGVAIGWEGSDSLAYRRRLRLRVDCAGQPVFFIPEKTWECAVLTPALVDAMGAVRARAASSPLLRGVAHLEIRAPDLDGHPGLFLTLEEGQALDLDAVGSALPPFVVSTAAGAPACQRWAVGHDAYSHVPIDAFIQVHEATNRLVLASLAASAVARGAQTFFDAYAGAGNHAIALANAGLSGVATDVHAEAIAALQRSAREQRLAIDAEPIAAAVAAPSMTAPDLLVANPPRAGLGETLHSLATLGAPQVALITYTTTALGRDVRGFVERGYRLDRIVAFDMFPQTKHVETLAWLTC